MYKDKYMPLGKNQIEKENVQWVTHLAFPLSWRKTAKHKISKVNQEHSIHSHVNQHNLFSTAIFFPAVKSWHDSHRSESFVEK